MKNIIGKNGFVTVRGDHILDIEDIENPNNPVELIIESDIIMKSGSIWMPDGQSVTDKLNVIKYMIEHLELGDGGVTLGEINEITSSLKSLSSSYALFTGSMNSWASQKETDLSELYASCSFLYSSLQNHINDDDAEHLALFSQMSIFLLLFHL